MINTEDMLSIKDDKSILTNYSNDKLFNLKVQLSEVRKLSNIVEDYVDRCLDRTIGQQLQSELYGKKKDVGSATFNPDEDTKVVARITSSDSWDKDMLRACYEKLSEKFDKETLDNIFQFSVLASAYNNASPTIKKELQKCRTRKIGENIKYNVTIKRG